MEREMVKYIDKDVYMLLLNCKKEIVDFSKCYYIWAISHIQ